MLSPELPPRKSNSATIGGALTATPSDPIIQAMQIRAKEYERELALMKEDRPFMAMLGIMWRNCPLDELAKFLKGTDAYWGTMTLEECFQQIPNQEQIVTLIKCIAPTYLGEGRFGGTYLNGDHAMMLFKIYDFNSNESPSITLKKISWLLTSLLELPVSELSVARHGRDLTNINLSGLVLSKMDLSSLNLSGAKLIGTNLENANLGLASLQSADLSHANLSYAILQQANMKASVLIGAILINANFKYADLSGAKLISAKLTGARLDCNLNGADLSYADASEAIFNCGNLFIGGATLHNTDLLCTNFYNADIRSVDLKFTNWGKALWIDVKCDDEDIIKLGKKQKWEKENAKSISFCKFSNNQNFNAHGMPKELVDMIKNNLAKLAVADQSKKS